MARYITLITFTEQGTKTIKDWDKRVAASRERLERAGGKVHRCVPDARRVRRRRDHRSAE
jgi:uncharacterized protein with GYD domain